MLEHFAIWVEHVIQTVGYPGLFTMIVLESTLVPIPSELIMPFAGSLAAKGEFSLAVILAINSIAAMTGSGISYWIGSAGGRPLVVKYGKFAGLRAKDLERTETFFNRHGRATILIGRFLPVVRHVISVPAGVAKMPLVPFFTQTFIGATIWGTVLIFIGYKVGDFAVIAAKLKHVDAIVGICIILVLLALAVRFVVRRRRAVGATPAD
ncbi:MAG TPA: DedA family protein [Kofleriaceae bacterium]|jgi:membrane protein DedA with SNARE-associated domain